MTNGFSTFLVKGKATVMAATRATAMVGGMDKGKEKVMASDMATPWQRHGTGILLACLQAWL